MKVTRIFFSKFSISFSFISLFLSLSHSSEKRDIGKEGRVGDSVWWVFLVSKPQKPLRSLTSLRERCWRWNFIFMRKGWDVMCKCVIKERERERKNEIQKRDGWERVILKSYSVSRALTFFFRESSTFFFCLSVGHFFHFLFFSISSTPLNCYMSKTKKVMITTGELLF